MSARNDVDKHAARELFLWTVNERDFQPRAQAIIKNLARKKLKAAYDSMKAVKLWMYLADAAAKKYVADFGSRGDNVGDMFNKATRTLTAIELENYYYEEVFEKAKRLAPSKKSKHISNPSSGSIKAWASKASDKNLSNALQVLKNASTPKHRADKEVIYAEMGKRVAAEYHKIYGRKK